MKKGKSLVKTLREDFIIPKQYAHLTPGKALKIYRELMGLTQAELATVTGLKQATLSSLENDRISLGVERAKVLARALKIHPAVLAFADWDSSSFAA